MKADGRTRIPLEKAKELGIEKDDTDTVIAFKEAMCFLAGIGGRRFC